MEHRHAYRRPTIIIFLDLKAAFDSVDRQILWYYLECSGMPTKYVQILRSLYSSSHSQVRTYGEITQELFTLSGVRQGCPASPFLFNFAIEGLLQLALPNCCEQGIQLLPGNRLTNLEYADDVVLIGENTIAVQEFLNHLSCSANSIGMRFAPTKCKVLLQDWVDPPPTLLLDGKQLERVNSFVYLGSTISPGGQIADEISSRICKARQAFANLSHLWRRKDVRLATKGRVYAAAVRPVLLYASETWPLRCEDIRKLEVFDYRCLRSIARIWWDHRISNEDVLRRVFGARHRRNKLIDVLQHHQLRWLGHVLRMPETRLPRRALFAKSGEGWKKPPGGQVSTWQQRLKKLTAALSHVGRCRLPGWGARDDPHQWLHTLNDMASNRDQWRLCTKRITFLN